MTELRSANVYPVAGSGADAALGVGWFATTALNIVAGALLVLYRQRWRTIALIGVALSVPALMLSGASAAAGLVIDGVVMWAAVVSAAGRRWRVSS